MNEFSLDKHTSSYYLNLFREEDIRIYPNGTGRFRKEHGWCWIGEEEDDLSFGVYFKLIDSRVDDSSIRLAQEILSQIVELDKEARSKTGPDDFDHEEYLMYIEIADEEIVLNYAASTVNTEWGAYFARDEDGSWKYKGMGWQYLESKRIGSG